MRKAMNIIKFLIILFVFGSILLKTLNVMILACDTIKTWSIWGIGIISVFLALFLFVYTISIVTRDIENEEKRIKSLRRTEKRIDKRRAEERRAEEKLAL